MARPSLTILADLAAEGWPSMDRCADELYRHAAANRAWDVDLLRPAFPDVLPPSLHRRRPAAARNAERLNQRLRLYPRHLRRLVRQRPGDRFYHLADHSYGQLLHAVPAGRGGAYCHDLDTFRSLLDPAREPRPAWFRLMTAHVLRGLRKAAVVFVNTRAVGDELLATGWFPAEKIIHAPLGVADAFRPGPPGLFHPSLADVREWLGGRRFVLHVGSCVPRKRVDVLLAAFARLRAADPDLWLIQAGGTFTADHLRQLTDDNLQPSVRQERGLPDDALADLYRTAAAVAQPSAAEGFGLPVLEAVCCGAAVVASALPALREAGGPLAAFVPPGDPAALADALTVALCRPGSDADPLAAGRDRHRAFYSWTNHAATILAGYGRLAEREAGS